MLLYNKMSNQNFSRINGAAGQVAKLNVGSGTIGSLTVNSVTSKSVNSIGKGTFVTRYAYVPTSFSTLAVGSAASLMNKPGLSQATSSSDDVFVMPSNVSVTRVIINNNGITAAGGDFDLISSPTLNGTNTSSTEGRLLNTTTSALINSGAMVGGGTAIFLSAAQNFGGTGSILPSTTAATGIAGFKTGTSDIYLNVVGKNTPFTSGDLCVEITYFNPFS